MSLDAGCKPRQNETIAYRVIEGRAALIVPGSALCWLNPVATHIWERLDGRHTAAEIATRLCESFEVDYDTAHHDTLVMIDEFARRRIVEEAGMGGTPGDGTAPADGADSEPWAMDQCDIDPAQWTPLSRLAHEKCIPLQVTLEVTLHCNLACAHCYNFDREVSYTREQAAGELSPEEIHGIIDQLADANCLYLWFTGGEAMVHPRLRDFIRHAKERRFSVGLKTNGSLLTPQTVAMLREAGTTNVHVSVYGATPQTHDEFTKRPGSLERTLRGVRLAREAGMQVRINMSVTSSNVNEVPQVIEFAEATGCTYGINPFISNRYDGTTSSRDHQLDRDALKSLYTGPLRSFLGEPNYDTGASMQCGCARGTCGITATGIVYPCIGSPIPSGSLREKSFREIWETSPEFLKIRGLTPDHFDTCKTCPDRPFCGRNSGFVYSNTGNYTGPEAFTCMDASVRREAYFENQDPLVETPNR